MSGAIDIAIVAVADGQQVGNRAPIARLDAGDFIMAPTPAAAHRLVARSADRARLESIEALTAPMLDAWIACLGQATLGVFGNHPGGVLLLPGDTTHVPADATLRGGHRSVWAEITDGTLHLFGHPDRVFRAGTVLPLTPATWLSAGPEGATIRGLATTEALDAREAVETWQAAVLDAVASRLLAREAEEQARVHRSTQWSQDLLRATRDGVAEVLIGRPGPLSPIPDDPLIAACRIVAHGMGVALADHPASPVAPGRSRLDRIARATRMPVRRITLEDGWWRGHPNPMIAFRRDDGHPLAVLPGRGGDAWLHDPVGGEAARLTREQAARLDPTAFVLYPALPDHPVRSADLLGIGLGGTRRDILLLLLTACIGASLGLAVPIATGVLVDVFIPNRDPSALVPLGALLLAVVAVTAIVRVAQDMTVIRLGGRAANRLQPAIIDRAIRLPMRVLLRFSSADLAERARVIDALYADLTPATINALLSGPLSLIAILVLALLSPTLAAASLLMAAPILLVALLAGRTQRTARGVAAEREMETARFVQRLVAGIIPLRAAGAEERAFARWGRLHRDSQAAVSRLARADHAVAAFSAAYGVVALALFFLAMRTLPAEEASVGRMVMMLAIHINFITTMLAFADALRRLPALRSRLERASPLLTAEPEMDGSRTDPGELSGRIDVSHLTFGYPGASSPILRDISLAIEPGTFVAIVGPSGCGKSTLLKLLLGLEQPDTGGVLYDGRDLRRLDPRAVRRQIGTVLQSDRLTPGTVFENIAGISGCGNDEVWEAAGRAGIAEEIGAMPMGMHTLLTDDGKTLSGGQAQRILIARAMIGAPRILLFDEATSALDNRSQALVMRGLERMAITRVVVAHRLSTVRNADRIIVMVSGCIVQSGRYEELAAMPGPFADLMQRQEPD